MNQQNHSKKPIKIGNYFFIEEIGSGYTSIVYKAWDSLNKIFVAIKVIDLNKREIQENVNYFITNEKLILQKIKQKKLENIVELLQSIITKEKHYLVLEYCEGNLKQIIDQNKQGMDEKLVIQYLLEINRGMINLHDNYISHRDLKPANILIKNGQIKISDFGLAKILKPNDEQSNQIVGTQQYMAPEIKPGEQYNSRLADMYSFGVVLYQMLYKQIPSKPPIFIPSLKNQSLQNLITKMLQIQPENRLKWEELTNEKLIIDENLQYSQEFNLYFLIKHENKINYLYYCFDSIEQFTDHRNINHQRGKLIILRKIEKECERYVDFCSKVELKQGIKEQKISTYENKKYETNQKIVQMKNLMQKSGYLYESELNVNDFSEQLYKVYLTKYLNELADYQQKSKDQEIIKSTTSLICKIKLVLDLDDQSVFLGEDFQKKFENLLMVSQTNQQQQHNFDKFFQSFSDKACLTFLEMVKQKSQEYLEQSQAIQQQSQVILQEKSY